MLPAPVETLLNANGNLQDTLAKLLGQPIKLTVHQHEPITQSVWHRHISVSLEIDPTVLLYEARSEVQVLDENFGELLHHHNLGQLFKMTEYSNPNFHLSKVYCEDGKFGREYRLWREGLYDCLIREDYTPQCYDLIIKSQ